MKWQFQKTRTAETSCMHLPPLNFKTAIYEQLSVLLIFKQISFLLAKVNILHFYPKFCQMCSFILVRISKKIQDMSFLELNMDFWYFEITQ